MTAVLSWEDWLASREARRAVLKKCGLDAPSRRKSSYNTSERFMRASFGGRRVPVWADGTERSET
ncbi:MAG: hypothetical protein K6G91_07100 [Kiritimatiellae bacterium]|nr:hypothetical protein [Kiritimatiellia bacterium]